MGDSATQLPGRGRHLHGRPYRAEWNVGCLGLARAWDIGLVTQINPVADELVGECLSLPEVAARLGLPIGRVKQLLRDRKLIAVTRPGGERAIPAAFIDGAQIVKGLPGTLTVLFDCGFDDV